MAWLERLKTLFSLEVNAPLLNITVNNGSSNSVGDRTGHIYDRANGSLKLYPEDMEPSKRSQLNEIFVESVADDNKLLRTDAHVLLEELYKYNKETKDSQTLKFFHKIIPDSDYRALESSLFLRYCSRRGQDVNKMKVDLKNRFGDRGNNISNLCTAGYFESFLIPLYDQVSEEKFKELYELIVTNIVLTVFVNGSMTVEQI